MCWRASTDTAACTNPCRATSSTSGSTSGSGRLSTQKKWPSSSARSAVLFPAPESPVTMTMSIPAGLLDQVTVEPSRRGLRDRVVEAILELAGRVVAHELEELVAGRHLDDGRHVAPRPDRDAQVRQLLAQHREHLVLDAEPVVLGVLVPVAELDDELDLLDVAH